MSGLATRQHSRSTIKVKREDVRYFNNDIPLVTEDMTEEDDSIVVKKALILVEGNHVDSQGRPHRFPAQRVLQIAENTNRWFSQGNRIPWLTDHKKTQWDTIGDLDGSVEVRRVTKADVTDPRCAHLVGKLGIFVDKLVGRGKAVVEKVKDGIISTLSPGLDIAVDIIKEVSATPTPAIAGLRIFSRRKKREANFAVTWDEAEAESLDSDELYQQFMDYAETYWDMATGISQSADEELQGQDPQQLQMDALQGFMDRIAGLVGLDEPTVDDPNMAGSGATPSNQTRAQLITQDGRQANMAMNMAQAAFELYGGDRAEFAKKRRFGRRSKGSASSRILGRTTAGRVARAGALAGVIGAGLAARRYGRLGQGSIGLNTRRLGADVAHVKRGVGRGLQGAGERIIGAGGRVARAGQGMMPGNRRFGSKRARRNIPITQIPTPRRIQID